MSIKWTKCADCPQQISIGKSTAVGGKLYCTKKTFVHSEDQGPVYCYDPIRDEWSTLPPLTFRLFSLGQIEDKLVTFGGVKQPPSKERVSELYTFMENSGKWRKTYPPMPTARSLPMVFSVENNVLLVVGGHTFENGRKVLLNVVEVFKVNESQWYKAPALPVTSNSASMFGTVLNSEFYLVGGLRIGTSYSKVMHTSAADLVDKALPASQKSDGSDVRSSDWTMLPHTPTNKSILTSLAGLLISLGGEDRAIHMYSPSINSWVHVGTLPELRLLTTVGELSPMEVLMIGGFDGSKDTNAVYKGTLQLSM